MANFLESLVSLITGGAQAQPAPAEGAPAQQPARIVLPQSAPAPTPRPAGLPQGSFAPNRQPMQPMANPQLLSLLGGGGGARPFVRAMGAGMANMGNTGGDPFVAFGRGFGGATAYQDEQDLIAAKSAAANEAMAYERQQDAEKLKRTDRRAAEDLELRRASEARQAKTADLQNQKTLAEIKALARNNGISVSQALEIERISQAAGENLYGTERQKMIDDTRQRLLDQFSAGGGTSTGLSDSSKGLSTSKELTATGPNGQKVVLRNGAWEPM